MKSFPEIFREFTLPLLTALLVASGGCTRSPLDPAPNPAPNPGGVKITLRIQPHDPVETRATSGDYIDPSSVFLFVFDGNDDQSILREWMPAVSLPGGDGTQFYANLTQAPDLRYVYVVANTSGLVEEMSDRWIPGITSLFELREGLLSHALREVNNTIVEMPMPQPMAGVVSLPDGIVENMSIGTAADPVLMVRSTARVSVIKNPSLTSFIIAGANLANAAQRGYLLQNVSDPKQVGTSNYGTESLGIEGVIATPSADGNTYLYGYESPAQNGTFVVLKASFNGISGYYRLDLIDAQKDQYDLQGNHDYRVTINQVQTPGYRTAAEAMANTATNAIDYDVSVTDPSGHDIASNGEYYLALSNSELFLFSSATYTGVGTTITSNAPSSVATMQLAVLDADGTSASLIGTHSDIPVVNDGAVHSYALEVTLPATTTYIKYRLRLGSLAKDFSIYRRPDVSKYGELIKEFSGPDYVTGRIPTPVDEWVYFTRNAEIFSSRDLTFRDLTDTYLYIEGNAGFGDDLKPRTGEITLFRADDGGCTKVIFHQETFNVYTDLDQSDKDTTPYSYVGAFHRWNETAERIIRIDIPNIQPNTPWSAFVVSGNFIRLTTSRSPDPGIGVDPYGSGDNPVYTTPAQIEANCQLSDGRVEINGLGPVYFRIGLTGRLPSASSSPRYGLIAFQIGSKTKLIYVRQGETPDYLMRPIDPIDTQAGTELLANRPYAAPFACYNLTVPSGVPYADLGPGGYSFTQYPSQAGYMFQGASTKAWLPYGTDAENWSTTIPNPMLWQPQYESCPSGYRRPDDGPIDGSSGSSGVIALSEIRQSLWLYPQSGSASSNLQNILWGYLADGYFDRRAMEVPSGLTPYQTYKTAVGQGAQVAYVGGLIFNPYNFSSIFIPATGDRSNSLGDRIGKLVSAGGAASVWTRSMYLNTSRYWTAQFGLLLGGTSGKLLADNYTTYIIDAWPVRCVKK